MASAVVITPRIEQRKNLEAFFQQLPRLGGLSSANVLSEAQILIQNSSIPDYVFLSDHLEKSEREKFILWIKGKKQGSKTIFITICGSDSTSTETLADHLAAGTHAILKEPITLQALQDVLGIAKGVKFQGTQTRLKTAAGLFLSSAIDKMTAEKGIPVEPKTLKNKVNEAIKDFKQLTGVSLTLEAVRPTDTNESSASKLERYKGVSHRVKSIYEQRIAKLVSKLFEK
jgi:hypothetical protein